jgi:hypothetical protein
MDGRTLPTVPFLTLVQDSTTACNSQNKKRFAAKDNKVEDLNNTEGGGEPIAGHQGVYTKQGRERAQQDVGSKF